MPRIPKPLCFYFSSVQKATLGTGEILWEGAALAQRRRAILATSPRFRSLYAFIFLRSESNVRHGRDPVEGPVFPFLASCFGAGKAGHFGHQPTIPKPLCFYFSSVQKAMLGTGEILWAWLFRAILATGP